MESNEQAVSIWDSDEVKAVEGESGSGGWVSEAEITFGYKVFAAGRGNEETFWKFDVANAQSREKARTEAAEFARSVGAKQPTAAIAVILPKDRTYLYDTTRWQGDRWFVIPTYTKSYEEVLKPSLKGAEASLGVQWVRIGFKLDPFKPTRRSLNLLTGEEQDTPNLVPWVVEKFENKEAAMKAIESGAKPHVEPAAIPFINQAQAPAAPEASGEYPSGWDEASWNFAVNDIKDMSKAGKSPAEISKAYDIPVSFVIKALGK